MARLVIFRGRRKEGSLDLVDREYTLGRAEDADIRIENPLVSRRHAIISYRDHAWRIEDLGTPNGLYVNGGRIEGHSLVPGDHIEIGQHVLIFQGSGDEWLDVETQPGFSRPSEGLADSPTTVLPAIQLQSLQSRVRERMGCHLAMQHEGRREDFPLSARTHCLGFDDECDIRLPGSTMFGKKAAELVRKSEDEYAIVSLSSLAPVRVNGEKVSTRLLHDRDRIDVKGFTLTYFRNIH
jgi:pSer/pThr/pTyr-binding forkhead associated (FHA) protein